MKKLTFLFLLLVSIMANAANTITTVTQVTGSVAVTADEDYVITSSTPFTTTGSINIQNVEHGAVILAALKPSIVNKKWLKYVKINGEDAVDGTNCQVKMYNKGTIIFPYGSGFAPLTCYTEEDFGGESCNTYTEGHSGGFMKTLSTTALNNQIRSFKLKRGYMVTFALGTSGWGYSRCFIADTEDLEMNMPDNMSARVSSYRLFKWNYFSKMAIANETRASVCDELNVEACYSWGCGENRLPDTECIPVHIKDIGNWPAPSACGSVDYSCHLKTNNEPYNPDDDPKGIVETVSDILVNWQELMRTGMRICTPSSWDGSDYWNGTGKCIAPFLDSIDTRGWRCDIVDAHCYWPEGNFPHLENYWWPNYHRPIWVSEWIWGASWNGNGCWGAGVTDNDIYNTTGRIVNTLINSPHVERIFYWNSESKGHVYESSITSLGTYYSNVKTEMGYNAKYQYVPKVVFNAPTNLAGTYNKTKGTFALTWNDSNGDMLDSVVVECKLPGATRFTWRHKVELKDCSSKNGASYSYTDIPEKAGAYYYRIAAYPIGTKTAKYSNEVSVSITETFGNADVQYGKVSITSLDAVTSNFTETLVSTPAVFMGVLSNKNSSLYPGNLITSAGKTKFSYQIQPWQAQGSSASTMSKVEETAFLAMPEGNYKYGTLDCEVGIIQIQDEAEVTFKQAFPEGVVPVVLVEVNNPAIKKYPYSLNIVEVTNTGFKVKLQYEADIAKEHAITLAVKMGYLAITPGMGNLISEVESSEVIGETIISKTPCTHEGQACLEVVADQTIRDTYSNIVIAAGVGENTMWGRTARNCTFKNGDDQFYFSNPKVFGKCQSSNYPGASILRIASYLTETDAESPYKGYVTGMQVRRQVDGTNSSPHTQDYADPLGYVVIDNGLENTYGERVERVVRYEPLPDGVNAATADEVQIVAIYNLSGAPLPSLQKGINVVKYSDGSFKKVLVK